MQVSSEPPLAGELSPMNSIALSMRVRGKRTERHLRMPTKREITAVVQKYPCVLYFQLATKDREHLKAKALLSQSYQYADVSMREHAKHPITVMILVKVCTGYKGWCVSV